MARNRAQGPSAAPFSCSIPDQVQFGGPYRSEHCAWNVLSDDVRGALDHLGYQQATWDDRTFIFDIFTALPYEELTHNAQVALIALGFTPQLWNIVMTRRDPYAVDGVRPNDAWLRAELSECVVCMTNLRNVACLPCRHIVMCDDCARKIAHLDNQCPVCRTEIATFEYVRADMLGDTQSDSTRYFARSEGALARPLDVSVVRGQLMRAHP